MLDLGVIPSVKVYIYIYVYVCTWLRDASDKQLALRLLVDGTISAA